MLPAARSDKCARVRCGDGALRSGAHGLPAGDCERPAQRVEPDACFMRSRRLGQARACDAVSLPSLPVAMIAPGLPARTHHVPCRMRGNPVSQHQSRGPAAIRRPLLRSAALRVGRALDRGAGAGNRPSTADYKFCANSLAPFILGDFSGLACCSKLDPAICCPFALQAAAAVCTAADGSEVGFVASTRGRSMVSAARGSQCRLQAAGRQPAAGDVKIGTHGRPSNRSRSAGACRNPRTICA